MQSDLVSKTDFHFIHVVTSAALGCDLAVGDLIDDLEFEEALADQEQFSNRMFLYIDVVIDPCPLHVAHTLCNPVAT